MNMMESKWFIPWMWSSLIQPGPLEQKESPPMIKVPAPYEEIPLPTILCWASLKLLPVFWTTPPSEEPCMHRLQGLQEWEHQWDHKSGWRCNKEDMQTETWKMYVSMYASGMSGMKVCITINLGSPCACARVGTILRANVSYRESYWVEDIILK